MIRRSVLTGLISLIPTLSLGAQVGTQTDCNHGDVASAEAEISLIMAERKGCVYCIRWKETIGPIYPKTAAGKFAPLRVFDVDEPYPEDLELTGPVIYSPTFLIAKDGVELARIEGYASEDFFWGMLERHLARTTDFQL